MSKDHADEVLANRLEERPELSFTALGVVMRIQAIAKKVPQSTGAMTNRVDGLTKKGELLVDKASETRFKAAYQAQSNLAAESRSHLNEILKSLLEQSE